MPAGAAFDARFTRPEPFPDLRTALRWTLVGAPLAGGGSALLRLTATLTRAFVLSRFGLHGADLRSEGGHVLRMGGLSALRVSPGCVLLSATAVAIMAYFSRFHDVAD